MKHLKLIALLVCASSLLLAGCKTCHKCSTTKTSCGMKCCAAGKTTCAQCPTCSAKK